MGDTYVNTCTKSSQVCGLVVTAAVVAFKAFRCSSSHLCNCLRGIKQLLSYDNMQTPFVSFAGTELAELLAIREQYKKILESSFGSSNTFQSGRFDLGRKLKISSPPQNLPNIVSDHADDASLGNNLHINSFLCSIVYDSQMWAKTFYWLKQILLSNSEFIQATTKPDLSITKLIEMWTNYSFITLSCITFGIALVALRLFPYSTVPGIVRHRQLFVFSCSGEPKLQCNVIRIRGLVSNAGTVQQSFVAKFRSQLCQHEKLVPIFICHADCTVHMMLQEIIILFLCNQSYRHPIFFR